MRFCCKSLSAYMPIARSISAMLTNIVYIRNLNLGHGSPQLGSIVFIQMPGVWLGLGTGCPAVPNMLGFTGNLATVASIAD
jgi:hypothetical protein